jgi:hypothetical protein
MPVNGYGWFRNGICTFMVATTSLNMITVCAIGLVTLILTAPVKTKKDAYQIEFQVWPILALTFIIICLSGR